MNWLIYLLQVNLYLILFYGFYRLLLSNETFYGLNRAYLVASAALSFFIPVLQSDWVRSWFVTEQVNQVVYSFYHPEMLIVRTSPALEQSLTWGDVFAIFYSLGFLICLIRFGVRMNELVRFLKPKNRQRNPKMAFSFFNKLFVGKHLTQQETIVAHERVHIRQLHSADVMLFEIIGLFCWFNPILYTYKKAIREIHEFMADQVAVRHEASAADYAMLLFSQQFGVVPSQLTNHFFNESMLKLRIKMLMKEPSSNSALYKYAFIAPLFGLMVVLSSATLVRKPLEKVENVIESLEGTPVEEAKSAQQVLKEAGIDVSKALIISPALKAELRYEQRKNEKIAKDTTEVFSQVDHQPEFKGGMVAFGKYLEKNLKYPEAAVKANIEGKVYVQFTVNIDGSTSNLQLLKGVGYGLDEEAMRVIRETPRWIPGILAGRAVRSRFTLPISFVLGGKMTTNRNKDEEYVFCLQIRTRLKYPLEAFNTNLQGIIYIGFSIDNTGKLFNIETLSSKNQNKLFEEEVINNLNGKFHLSAGNYVMPFRFMIESNKVTPLNQVENPYFERRTYLSEIVIQGVKL